MLLRLAGFKIIYDVHEDVRRKIVTKYYIPGILRYPIALMVSLLEWCAANSFNAMVPVTRKIGERFPADKTVVVRNFPIRAELAVPDPTPYHQRALGFAYVGGIEPIRGAFEMIHALGQLLKTVPGARLELAGNFSPTSLEHSLRRLAGWDAVHYHGQVGRHKVAQILSRAKAGLVVLHPEPTYFESYPIKMFEYMSAGLPVIASDFPVWRRIINGAECGLLVDPLNSESIAEAMRWILDHPAEAEAMGRRGRQAVEHTYHWDTEAAKLVDLYKKLLAA